MVAAEPTHHDGGPSTRALLRVILIVVLSALALYVIYRLRTPISYVLIAAFIAVAASGPVNSLNRYMRRGFAITLVYLGIILMPLAIGAILIPPLIEGATELVNDLPSYAQDLDETFSDNETLSQLNEDYDLTAKLEEAAGDLAGDLGSTAGTLADIGGGIVSSLFAVVTILVLSMFLVSRGRGWVDGLVDRRPRAEADVIKRALDHMAFAVGGYIGGALAQATVAGIAAFLMLEILGAPATLALAVVIAIFDIVPLVGATLGAVIVGIVLLFAADFPADVIAWAIFAIVYQQFENYVVQPRIQSRAVNLDPFVVVIAALFGGTLFGVIGALVAIPIAAAMQIGIREYLEYRKAHPVAQADGGTPPTGPPPATAET
jgi:predicted PurR-regulated permease PerM